MTRPVGIRDLKTHFSRYIREVKTGTTVTVTEHGRPVAEIRAIPEARSSDEEVLRQMAAKGLVTLPTNTEKRQFTQRSEIPGPSIVETISEDREDRV